MGLFDNKSKEELEAIAEKEEAEAKAARKAADAAKAEKKAAKAAAKNPVSDTDADIDAKWKLYARVVLGSPGRRRPANWKPHSESAS